MVTFKHEDRQTMSHNRTPRSERHGTMKLLLADDVNAQHVIRAMNSSGEMLKDGKKRIVRRVGDWVIKSTKFNAGVGPLKVTTNPKRYRNGWTVSLVMTQMEFNIPRPIAYVEHSIAGFIWRSSFIYEYLEDHVPALEFIQIKAAEGDGATIDAFLTTLADALNALAKAHVYHRDLKLANILTKDGTSLYIVDLDEAHMNRPYVPEQRMRNHIQIAGGMRLFCRANQINQFLQQTLPPGENPDAWIDQVWKGIGNRRATRER